MRRRQSIPAIDSERKMMNERIASGSLSELRDALKLLSDAHTRDDDRVGFVVEVMANPLCDRGEYIDAWSIVRQAIGLSG
jgi:hypothetical protein